MKWRSCHNSSNVLVDKLLASDINLNYLNVGARYCTNVVFCCLKNIFPFLHFLLYYYIILNDSILTELGLERELMGRVAKLKLQYFGLITRGSAGQLALTVLEGIMEGLRHQGRPSRQWIHDIEEWTGCEYIQLKEMSQDRAQWRKKISE